MSLVKLLEKYSHHRGMADAIHDGFDRGSPSPADLISMDRHNAVADAAWKLLTDALESFDDLSPNGSKSVVVAALDRNMKLFPKGIVSILNED